MSEDDDETSGKEPSDESGMAESTTGEPATTTAETTDAPDMTGTTGEPPSSGMVALELVVDGLVAPTSLVAAPDGTLIVLDQPGMAYRIVNGELQPFGDLTEVIVPLEAEYDERGFLGLAFHPMYPADPRVFLYYSAPRRADAPPEIDHTNVLSEVITGETGMLELGWERFLGEIDWPQVNHNGGGLAFGPDDRLYVGLGDGGNYADIGPGHPELGNGQDYTTPLGSILRIDPDPVGEEPYGAPDDNPFFGDTPGFDAIFAYGMRNPYSMSFDRETGELFVADVGQDIMEEIDIVEAGGNYGWNVREGTTCLNAADPTMPLPDCANAGADGEPFAPPILEYAHPGSAAADQSDVHGFAVIGGHVYRGSALPDLDGAYVFGDWSRAIEAPEGQIFVGRRAGEAWDLTAMQIVDAPDGHIGMYVRGFGQDADGEIYVLTSEQPGPTGETGAVWRLVPP